LHTVTYSLQINTTDDVTGWPPYCKQTLYAVVNMASRRQSGGSSDSSDSEEEVPTGRGSFPQPYAFEPTSASVNYHDDADSETGSDDGFQGVEMEVVDRTSGTCWCQCGNCVPMPSNAECTCCAEIASIQHRRNSQAHSLALGCITENPSFSTVCLDLEVLDVALLLMHDVRAESLTRPIASRSGMVLY